MRRAWDDGSAAPPSSQPRGVRLPRALTPSTAAAYGVSPKKQRPSTASRQSLHPNGTGGGGACPGVGGGLSLSSSSSTPQVGSAYVTIGKPILLSAAPSSMFGCGLPPSQSLPYMTAPGMLPPAPGAEASPIDAMRAELVELRRRERAYVTELMQLQAIVDGSDEATSGRSSAGDRRGHALSAEQIEEAVEARTKRWETELSRVRTESKAKLDEAHRHAVRLEAKLAALRGAVEAQAGEITKREREQHVELLYKQFTRRMMFKDLANGWGAWVEMWSERRHALWWMREARNRIQRPGLALGFRAWCEHHEAAKMARQIAQHVRKEAGLQGEASALGRELERVRTDYEFRLREKEEEKLQALERQLIELTGSAEERLALQAEKAKEERVELLRRQIMRRIIHAEVVRGWTAWHELWSAKTYAMRRLREVSERRVCECVCECVIFSRSLMICRPLLTCSRCSLPCIFPRKRLLLLLLLPLLLSPPPISRHAILSPQVGNHLHTPQLSSAFVFWMREWERGRRSREYDQLERESRSIEAQLRRARFENGQLELHKLALQDELKANQERLAALVKDTDDPHSALFLVPKLEVEVGELRAQLRESHEATKNAERLQREAEDDGSRQRANDKRVCTHERARTI